MRSTPISPAGNSSIVIKVAQISLVVILFGQLAFSAVNYYLGLPKPSWPFWGLLYLSCALLAFRSSSRGLGSGVYFVPFVLYIISSFFISGLSSSREFLTRIGFFVVGPYVCGLILGRQPLPILSKAPYAVIGGYIALLCFETIRNPAILVADRVVLYASDVKPTDTSAGSGGDPTQFQIGLAFGAACVIAFCFLVLRGRNRGRVAPSVSAGPPSDIPAGRNYMGAVHVPSRAVSRSPRFFIGVLVCSVFLLLYGSRSAVVSTVVTAGILLLWIPWVDHQKKLALFVLNVAVLISAYAFLSDDRKSFISEIRSTLLAATDFSGYVATADGSVYNRVELLVHSWRLFWQSPLVGIGAGNFGLKWGGIPAEFASPHSTIAQILVEYGLIGALLVLYPIAKLFRRFLRYLRSPEAGTDPDGLWIFGLWLFILIQSQFIGNIFYDYQLALVTGLLVSALHRNSAAGRRMPPPMLRRELRPRKNQLPA